MKSHLAFHDKAVYPDGSIIEMTIWELSGSVAGSKHKLKYSLFYGSSGIRILGYDNERGKGDHKHLALMRKVLYLRPLNNLSQIF